MNKNALYWIIALLVLLNIFTIFMLWQDHWDRKPDMINKKPGMFRPPNDNKPEFIQRELDLSDEQAVKFRNYKKEHVKGINQITDKIHNTKKILLDKAFDIKEDSLVIDSLINEIANLQIELEKTNISHIEKLKDICKPEQLKKLKIIFNEMMIKTEPPRKNRPGHLKPGIRKSKMKDIK